MINDDKPLDFSVHYPISGQTYVIHVLSLTLRPMLMWQRIWSTLAVPCRFCMSATPACIWNFLSRHQAAGHEWTGYSSSCLDLLGSFKMFQVLCVYLLFILQYLHVTTETQPPLGLEAIGVIPKVPSYMGSWFRLSWYCWGRNHWPDDTWLDMWINYLIPWTVFSDCKWPIDGTTHFQLVDQGQSQPTHLDFGDP